MQGFSVLGEGVIGNGGNIHMAPLPVGNDPTATNMVQLSFPATIRSWDSYPQRNWPKTWLASLDSGMSSKDGTICTVIKSLPLSFVEEVVLEDAEGQQLLQWTHQQQDIDIHLQVRSQ